MALSAPWLARSAPVLFVAPHPDDESIGCGGLIAVLRDLSVEVCVLLLTDGTASHPGSVRFPPAARRALRRRELLAALAELGVDANALDEAGLADGSVPGPAQAGFEAAVAAVRRCLLDRRPGAVVLPWRRDPHPDHRAANAIARAANAALAVPAFEIEYPLWLAHRGSAEEALQPGEGAVHRLDVGAAVPRKQRAVAAHRSQHGLVIDDDPDGFVLPQGMLARCAEPWETYYVVRRDR